MQNRITGELKGLKIITKISSCCQANKYADKQFRHVLSYRAYTFQKLMPLSKLDKNVIGSGNDFNP